jgi:hypothetical protein
MSWADAGIFRTQQDNSPTKKPKHYMPSVASVPSSVTANTITDLSGQLNKQSQTKVEAKNSHSCAQNQDSKVRDGKSEENAIFVDCGEEDGCSVELEVQDVVKQVPDELNESKPCATSYLYFKVRVAGGNDLNLGGIILPGNDEVTFGDIRRAIVDFKQSAMPFSSFLFDLGGDFVIGPAQEGLEVKDHVDGNGSRQNPFQILIKESK